MELQAKLKRVLDTVNVTDKFKKREIHVETDGQYPQTISLQLSQEKVSLTDNIEVGSECKFHLNLRGREFLGADGVLKVFNSLEVWKIEVLTASAESTNPPF
jgi:hypothetical protein